jgi:sulfur-oxidizing protein SoxY
MTTRRTLIAGGGLVLLLRPAWGTPESMRAAIAAFSGGKEVRTGRVTLGIDPLVENGNAVPVSVSVQSPMTPADHVQRIAIFAPLNPLPEVAVFHLSPASGRAQVSTRMRMADTQTIVALAVMNDGSVWRHSVDVVVTLAACLEGG